MNKIKIIDLLNMISKGEEVPKKIKYKNNILYYDDDCTKEYLPTFNYYDEEGNNSLIEDWLCQYINDEVEIIEEKQKNKKIEKLDLILDEQFSSYEIQAYIKETQEKVNEIIDKINEE